MGYAIYQIEFSNEATYPFYKYWAMTPNYITIQNEYVEFYYNQMTYDKNFGVRQYKGAELTTNFVTIKDGWYGYKVYLTDDQPKNANTTIITQILIPIELIHGQDIYIQNNKIYGYHIEVPLQIDMKLMLIQGKLSGINGIMLLYILKLGKIIKEKLNYG